MGNTFFIVSTFFKLISFVFFTLSASAKQDACDIIINNFLFYVLKRVEKVKKKLFEEDNISEKDNIKDTQNKNIVKINKKLFECQRETKKIPISSNENDFLLFPLNMPKYVDEILIPSGELPILKECPDINENSFLDPVEQQFLEKKAKSKEKTTAGNLEKKC
ncbi:unnamed protein product [Parnassius apollo]|uniref:(apollo) hypothetical protein n=1 Tax=Parnassius apollo TaxID=110799 RepID=A0A8S3XV66_PARAO|nr:unnamed protein product [Parnassius apollo]